MLLDRAVRQAMDGLDADDHLPAGYLDHTDQLATGLAQRLRLAQRRTGRDRRRGSRGRADTLVPGSTGTPTCAGPSSTVCISTGSGSTPRFVGDRASPASCAPTVTGPISTSVTVASPSPARIADAVDKARMLEVFTPDELGLNEQSALVLCRRLIREGLLEVVR